MITLDKFVHFMIWVIVLVLSSFITAVSIFGGWKIFAATEWQSSYGILATIVSLFIAIIIALVFGGFLLWIIREKILEDKKTTNEKQ